MLHIKNALLVNDLTIKRANILVKNDRFEEIYFESIDTPEGYEVIDAEGLYLLPGIIDTHVHFREPGLEHKADIYTESKAAVAGGVTTFIDMPNTIPPTTNIINLRQKIQLAKQKSLANFAFYIGATNDNIEEILNNQSEEVAGIKMFIGSSTGNLIINDKQKIEKILANSSKIIAVHSEDDNIIKKNLEHFRKLYGENIPINAHYRIRNVEACYSSTKYILDLANKYNSHIHLLHISTADELNLILQKKQENKNISFEVCPHHLWFNSDDYDKYGGLIKCNPSIKEETHRKALLEALKNDNIDLIGSDHAPHTLEEKNNSYEKCPSGIPLIQFSLQIMLELCKRNILSLPQLVKLMCHNPASLFKIHNRGYIRKNYYADFVIVNPNKPFLVTKENIYSKCGWSPFENYTFSNTVEYTFVNGFCVYRKGKYFEDKKGMLI